MPSSDVWLPIAALITGFLTKSFTDWIDNKRHLKRELVAREATRREQRLARKIEVQRQGMLDLQDAISDLVRAAARGSYEDVIAHRETGQWAKNRWSKEANDGFFIAQNRTARSLSVIRDGDSR